MPGGLHRHCCCEPPGLCGACPRFGESITAVVSGVEMCGPCMAWPGGAYIESELLSGSINGVHTLSWRPAGTDWCSWRSDPIARVRWHDWAGTCSGPCDCSYHFSREVDVHVHLWINLYTGTTVISVIGDRFWYFGHSVDEFLCEGEYPNQRLICGYDPGIDGYVFGTGGTITLSR